jgi:hypothetical protein
MEMMMDTPIDFEYMKPEVKLISVTPDAEKHMAYCARVSNPANQENEKFSGLLKYCIQHQHWSIFEQASMTVEINTTRGIEALHIKNFPSVMLTALFWENLFLFLNYVVRMIRTVRIVLMTFQIISNWFLVKIFVFTLSTL